MKRVLGMLLVAALVGTAWAGDDKHMAEMKATMAKCSVCKHLVAKMDAIGPMSAEVVQLDNGMAIVHTVKDPAKVAILHAAGDEMGKAGEACMTMTDEQAKTDLCPFCQQIRAAAKKGANVSFGKTKSGDMLVIASNDPAAQKDIAAMHAQCAAMMGGGEADAHAGHKH
jgi:hypothetical protein